MTTPGPARTRKYRFLAALLRVGTAALRWALRHDRAPAAFALLETTGRRSGEPRHTPVSNGLDGDVFWLVAAHGHQADFVRNIARQPRVRVKVGRTWRAGTATCLPDDDTRARSRTLPCRWDAALGRVLATTPLTVRVDLDPAGS